MDGPGFFVDDIYIKLETDIGDKKEGIIHTAYPQFDFPIFITKEESEAEKFCKSSYKFNKSILMGFQLTSQNHCSFKPYLNLPPILKKKCKERYRELIHEMKSQLEGVVNLQMMDLSDCDQRNKAFSEQLGIIKQATRKKYSKYKLKDCYVKLEKLKFSNSKKKKPENKKRSKSDKIFRQNSNSTSHMRPHNQEKIYKCSHCDKRFFDISQWKNHEMIHSISDPFSCEYCNKSFTMRKYLHAHLKWHHSDKFFRCNSCEKKFRSFQHLKVHLRSHTMEKPFECGKCYKTFSSSSVLKNHEKIHSGLNQFICNVCNKNFSTSFNLSRHMNLHLGTKPHQCRHCDKSFLSLDNLLMHKKVHEKEKILASSNKENKKMERVRWNRIKSIKKEKNDLVKPQKRREKLVANGLLRK